MRKPWRALALLGVAGIAAVSAAPAFAQPRPNFPAAGRCWQPPPPQTVEEAMHVAQNGAPTAPAAPAMLALSDGRLKAAYGAGLLVGWGETGRRPDFAVVTAVGMSALIAPFAFIGTAGDTAIADIFVCGAANAQDMAQHAIRLLDARVLEHIARNHETGGRLLVALPGSAARYETVWDLGAIAASRHPESLRHMAAIMLGAIDHTTFVDPAAMPAGSGRVVTRNPAFRRVGAGEAFLPASAQGAARAATYLIHNGVLFPDEGDEYAAAQQAQPVALQAGVRLLPAHDFFLTGRNAASEIRIASPRPYLSFEQRSAFDAQYMRALFIDTYRQGRMSREWRATFVDRNAGRVYGR